MVRGFTNPDEKFKNVEVRPTLVTFLPRFSEKSLCSPRKKTNLNEGERVGQGPWFVSECLVEADRPPYFSRPRPRFKENPR